MKRLLLPLLCLACACLPTSISAQTTTDAAKEDGKAFGRDKAALFEGREDVLDRLADWARDHLGEPPDFTCAEQQPYPQCVATLQGRSRPEISRVAARQCGDDLAAFRRSFVAPVYGAKASYQINLDHTEFALRSGVSDDAADRHDYVAAEISRMNGREWDRFVAIDRKSREDMRACQDERRCLEPSEGG